MPSEPDKNHKWWWLVVTCIVVPVLVAIIALTPFLFARYSDRWHPIQRAPEILVGWYLSFPNEGAAAVIVESQYVGKQFAASGRIERINASQPRVAIVQIPFVTCEVEPMVAATFALGENVDVWGLIRTIDSYAVHIEDCQVSPSVGP